MKKLILCGSALLFSLSFSYSQGWELTGGHDDFADATGYANGPKGQGLFWFDLTGGDTLVVNRPGNGALNITASKAGGCSGLNDCYPAFGVDFGNEDGTPFTIDLSGGADITIDIENTSTTDFLFMDVKLVDVNNVQSEYEPNVSDVTPSSTWDDVTQRKSLNGFTLEPGERKTITIDLSSVSTAIGGLTQNGTSDCGPGPFNCPPTSYQINPAKIKAILFRVNFGVYNIFLSEGDGDPTADTFIQGGDIEPFNGVIKLHDFKVGNVTEVTGVNESIINSSLSVYPNPAKESLTVSFDAKGKSRVSLTDVLGNIICSSVTNGGDNQIIMNTSGLSTGIYFLSVSTDNGIVSKKVVIE